MPAILNHENLLIHLPCIINFNLKLYCLLSLLEYNLNGPLNMEDDKNKTFAFNPLTMFFPTGQLKI